MYKNIKQRVVAQTAGAQSRLNYARVPVLCIHGGTGSPWTHTWRCMSIAFSRHDHFQRHIVVHKVAIIYIGVRETRTPERCNKPDAGAITDDSTRR